MKNPCKSVFYYISLFSIIFALLPACSQHDNSNLVWKPLKEIQQTATINMIGHWLDEGDRESFVRNIARVYEFENQEVKVNLKFPEEVYYDHSDRASNEKYTARVVSENITDWDIVRLNGEYREVTNLLNDPNWAKDHFVDFSQIAEFCDGTYPELLTNDAKADWNGVVPGPYVEGQYWALWCNLDVAAKIGIEIKQFGMTFDDFASYLKALDTYNQNNPNDYVIPLYESYVWETAAALGINLYASLLDSPEEFLKPGITEKRLKAWGKTLTALESIAKYHPLHPSWKETSWGDSHNMMIDGECLFYINGSWMYNIWKGIDENKVLRCMPAEFPSFKPHKIYPAAYQVTWGVPKNAPNRDEAVKFLLALNKPNIAEMWSRYTKCPTGIKGNLAGANLGGDHYEEMAKYVQESFGSNTYRYNESSSWILDDKHAETLIYFKDVIQGEMTANQAMKAIRNSIGR